MNYWKEKWVASIKDIGYWIIVFSTTGEILVRIFLKDQTMYKTLSILFFAAGIYGFFKVKPIFFEVPKEKLIASKFKLLGICFLATIAFIAVFTVIFLMITVL